MALSIWTLPQPRFKYAYDDVRGTASKPSRALKQRPPYSEARFRGQKVGIFFLANEAHRGATVRFAAALQDGLHQYRGFHQTYALPHYEYYEPHYFVVSAERARSYMAGAQHIVRMKNESDADISICFVITEDWYRHLPDRDNPYFAAKAVLLSNSVLAQNITVEKMRLSDEDLQWVLDSIAVQAYAKLGGIPWTMTAASTEPEIIMGVGEAQVDRERVFAFANVFNQNGAYLWAMFGQPVFGMQEYTRSFAERVSESLSRYEECEGRRPRRLVVHLYKPPGRRREVRAVEEAIQSLGVGIEYAILHIDHKTEFRVFDDSDASLGPSGGVMIDLDECERLLVPTGREVRWIPPRVVRIKLAPQSTYRELNLLTLQVANFTHINWAGFQPNNVPVTIKYPRLLSSKYASLSTFGEDWYGRITSTFLVDKVWFI